MADADVVQLTRLREATIRGRVAGATCRSSPRSLDDDAVGAGRRDAPAREGKALPALSFMRDVLGALLSRQYETRARLRQRRDRSSTATWPFEPRRFAQTLRERETGRV
jgi:hypothetical protein